MLEKLQDGWRNRIDMRIDSAIGAAGSFTLQTPKVRPKNVFSCSDVSASTVYNMLIAGVFGRFRRL